MKPVTLTFDNGPDPAVSPRVMDVLAERGIATTFFVLGQNIADPEKRAIAERAASDGHWIGNHTFSHSGPIGLDPSLDAPQREIGRTQELIGDLAHVARLFRPCGGGGKLNADLFRPRDQAFLIEGGYSCVLWNVVPGDWNDPDGWVERALDAIAAEAWPLVVLHDIPGACIDRLPDFLDRLASLDVGFRQDFPPDCVPLRLGEIALPDVIEPLVSAA